MSQNKPFGPQVAFVWYVVTERGLGTDAADSPRHLVNVRFPNSQDGAWATQAEIGSGAGRADTGWEVPRRPCGEA